MPGPRPDLLLLLLLLPLVVVLLLLLDGSLRACLMMLSWKKRKNQRIAVAHRLEGAVRSR